MPFTFHPQELDGVVVIEPRIFGDPRGYFLETWKREDFEAGGIPATFVQDNHSYSQLGVLRGIHYQIPPMAQGKLVRALEGRIWDVCVDLRHASRTFGRWIGVDLDGTSHRMLYVPPGFGHGFVVRSETAHVLYKCTAPYSVEHERGISWDDAELGIDWPLENHLVSDKDAALPPFAAAPMFEGDLT